MRQLRAHLIDTGIMLVFTLGVAAVLLFAFGLSGIWLTAVSVCAGMLLGKIVQAAAGIAWDVKSQRDTPKSQGER